MIAHEVRAAVAASGYALADVVAIGEGWRPVAQVVDPSAPVVAAFIDGVGAQRATDDRSVASMLGWKQVSYLAGLVPLASWSYSGIVPHVSVDNMRTRMGGGPVPEFALGEIVLSDPTATNLVSLWWDALVVPLIDRWHGEARLGRRALEAFAVSQAVGIVARAAPGSGGAAMERTDMFVHALPTPLQPMANVAEQRRLPAEWKPASIRTTCCLQYKLPSAKYCVTCNLLTDARRSELSAEDGYEIRPRVRGGQLQRDDYSGRSAARSWA